MSDSTGYARPRASTATEAVIRRFEGPYLRGEGEGRQTLAHLRRAVAGSIDDSPGTWPYVFQSLAGIGPSDQWDGGASDVERAVHAALVLWAQHQQCRSRPVNVEGPSLGRQVGVLSAMLRAGDEAVDAGTIRRFARLTSASTFDAQMRALTQLVSLMRANDVVLDYPRLADELRQLQNPERRKTILLMWARDLHRPPSTAPAPSNPEAAALAQEQE